MKYEPLTIDDYQDVVQMFHSESDRGAAVLAGSYVDNFLAIYLRSQMIEDKEVDNLFGRFGPLAEFSQRIECGYAFGLITLQARDDLNCIRKIRNHFAHHPQEARFDASPVKDWVDHLSAPAVYTLPDGNEIHHDNKSRFLMTISNFVAATHNAMLAKKEQQGRPNPPVPADAGQKRRRG